MKALWLEGGRLDVRGVDEPDSKGEAVVRVRVAGICNTDLELVKGYYPFTGVPGHEFTGVVESGPADLVGNRVVGEINAVCHECQNCARGEQTHCENRTVLGIKGRNGAFAERLSLPAENLHSLPDSISDLQAVFVEPLAAALRIREQVGLTRETAAAVIGDGKLGMLIVQALLVDCDNVTVFGRHPDRLELLEGRGAHVSTQAPGSGHMDVVVECTGNAEGFRAALDAVRPRGTIVMKSTYRGELEMDASRVVVNEVNLVGSRCGPFHPAIDLLARGVIDVDYLVSEEFALDEGPRAFEQAATKGTLKVLIRPE